MEELGPINYYVNDKLKQPICVNDDDKTDTFTFLPLVTFVPVTYTHLTLPTSDLV